MSRERSTWNREEIAKRAAMPKQADPYLMNQDHVKQQPSADKYVTGDPSDFAEDIHPSGGTWEAEYSGGQVKRNEIGMPEMRSDTFNHPEKTASEEVLTKKAALCVAIARAMLPKTASEADVEEQSLSFMHLPDSEVMSTYTRLAGQAEEGKEGEEKEGQGQQEQKQAGQVPPQFKENIQKKKDEAKDKDDDQGQGQKQANQQQMMAQMQQMQAQIQQMQQQAGQQQGGQEQQAQQQQLAQMQQQLAQMIQQAQAQQQAGQQQAPMQQQANQQQAPAQQAAQQQQAQMQQQAQQQMMAQMVEQAMQQGMSAAQAATYAAQQCMAQMQQQGQAQQQAQMQQQGDDQLIDQMLAADGGIQAPKAEVEIELESPSMDMADVQLGPEDEVLKTLFANDEQQQAEQAQQGQEKQAHAVRTAATRTVGTRPTGGVSQIGGGPGNGGGSEIGKLTSLWGSAPDVKDAFGLPNR